MTEAERRAAKIIALIEKQTKAATADPERARTMLIEEGIYTRKGNLRAKFGGGNASKVKSRT